MAIETDDAAPGGGSVLLPQGRVNGLAAFQQLVRDTLACAASQGWKEIIFCDATFADWPLGERAVADALQAWSKTGRKFTLLATRYDELMRRHARFVTWRKTWSHIIECRACPSADPLDFPSAIWSPQWVMRRLDLEHSGCIAGSEPERRLLLREELDEWLRNSSPGFPATVLGL
jgi:hypothetical protein